MVAKHGNKRPSQSQRVMASAAAGQPLGFAAVEGAGWASGLPGVHISAHTSLSIGSAL